MSDTPIVAGEPVAERNNTLLYAGVIVVEVIVVAGIWLFQRYFGT
jgi:hypothetical protein